MVILRFVQSATTLKHEEAKSTLAMFGYNISPLHLPRELSGADGYSARAGALRRHGHHHCQGIPSPVRGRGKLTPPGTIDLWSSEIAPGTTSNAVAVS